MQKLIAFLFAATLCSSSLADDWPQWMGKNRDNRWEATNIIDRFPAGGPKVVWRSKVAGGYSGPAVVGDRVFVTDFVAEGDVKVDNFNRATYAGKERVLCLDATTGKEVWKHEDAVTYAISYPAGPRCTPLVDGEFVYTLGAEGLLMGFKAKTGDLVWKHDLPWTIRPRPHCGATPHIP